MKHIYGRVMDKYTVQGIDSVSIFTKDYAFFTSSAIHGTYDIKVPRQEKRLYFVHNDYDLYKISLTVNTKVLNVKMKPLSSEAERYGEPSAKIIVAWPPARIILGGHRLFI